MAARLLSEGRLPKDDAVATEAQTLADSAVESSPRTPEFHDTKGWIAFLRGETNKALPELRLAVRGLPDSPEVHYHLGLAEADAGNTELARWHLSAAVGLGEKIKALGRPLSADAANSIRLARVNLEKLK